MHGDFSRVTFDPAKRFSAVLSLQGRVHVEADHNEHAAILQHYLRTLVTDLLGEVSFPDAAPGFEITLVVKSGTLEDLEIGFGRCYVDGLLVENRPPVARSFYHQPDAYYDPETDPFPSGGAFFVYLQVCERLVTWIEEPAIRDAALGAGGPDASARAKVAWQVRCEEPTLEGTPPKTANAAKNLWNKSFKGELTGGSTGTLRARAMPTDDDELCALAPQAGYRGPENQLYRIEIHSGGELGLDEPGAPPTFKWSRDNGSVVFPIDTLEDNLVTVSTLGRDDRSQLDVGDWVEVMDDARVGEKPADLHRVEDIDPAERRVTLDVAPGDDTGSDPALHPFLRRWDQQERPDLTFGADHAITATTGTPLEDGGDEGWIALEDGVEIRFERGAFRSGDYWLVPARVETGDVEWPKEQDAPVDLPPHGVHYHYAPLAFVSGIDNPTVLDLRS